MARAQFWHNVVRFQRDKVAPWIGLRNAIGVTLPLAVAAAMGAVSSGSVMAMGALNVSFSDSRDPYIQRAQRMLAASLIVGIGVFAGTLCGGRNWLIVAVGAAWAFAAGMLVALGTAPGDLGAISLVTLVVFAARPLAPRQALLAGALACAGGLLQMVLALALWPLRRYAPERRALGDLYLELARRAGDPIRATEAPPASAQSTQAQTALATLDRDHSVEAERYRSMLSQAERMRLALLTLARLATRIRRETPGAPEIARLERAFQLISALLATIGQALLADQPAHWSIQSLEELQAQAEALRATGQMPSPETAAMIADARAQMDALVGQLRAALELAAYANPEGAARFARREAAVPWRLRLAGRWATLRANLSWDSASFRHAIRLAVCVALAEAAGRWLELSRSYWLPMTVAIVLRPDFAATFSRGVLRLVGTFAGLLAATGLFHLLPPGNGLEVLLIGLTTFVLRALGPANYGIVSVSVTALVVLLFAVAGVAPKTVMLPRGLNTALGGAIALAAYAIWPTWERYRTPAALASLLEAYRGYFHALRLGYENPQAQFGAELDRTRLAARRARSNLEASVERLSAEPGTPAARLRLLGGMLASSHRLVHAMMALEADLSGTRPVPARPAFRLFAHAVELTLDRLAAALRGSPLDRSALPDLRERHRELARSGDALTERYALVNVETDRITNSLNTLREELCRWLVECV